MSSSRLSLLCLSLVLLALLSAAVVSAEVVGWRTDGTGRYPNATPPTTWAKDQGVVWSTPMPAQSNSHPVIVGDKLFVCCEPAILYCLNLADGAVLWQKTNNYEDVLPAEEIAQMKADKTAAEPIQAELRTVEQDLGKLRDALNKDKGNADLKAQVEAAQAKQSDLKKQLQPLLKFANPPTHPTNGYSTPTPVSDGQNVWVVFNTGVVACYDLQGNRQWGRLLEKPVNTPGDWGVSSSPVLAGDRLLTNLGNCVALNPATGETVWTAPTGMYWGTPIVTKLGDVPVAFTPYGQVLRLSDGAVLQKDLFRLSFNSPVLEGDTVYYAQIPGTASMAGQAFKLPAAAADQLQIKGAWQGRDERFYASPVLHEGLMYSANQLDTLLCSDASNGQVLYYKKLGLGGQIYPSVCMAGGLIFVTSDNGNTVVVKPGRTYEEVGRGSLGDTVRSTPVFLGTRVYIRGYKNMWCIGQ